jgi:hypothetical protein
LVCSKAAFPTSEQGPPSWSLDRSSDNGEKTKKHGKKKCGKEGANNDPAPAPAPAAAVTLAVTSSTLPEGVECWICLEQDDPTNGNRLERGCSCRGVAGFAYFNCLLNYIKDKSESMYAAENYMDFARPWTRCPNCNQDYIGKLAIKLAKSLMNHIEEEYDPDGFNKLLPLSIIVRTATVLCSYEDTLELDIIEEGKLAAEEMILIVLLETPMYQCANCII